MASFKKNNKKSCREILAIIQRFSTRQYPIRLFPHLTIFHQKIPTQIFSLDKFPPPCLSNLTFSHLKSLDTFPPDNISFVFSHPTNNQFNNFSPNKLLRGIFQPTFFHPVNSHPINFHPVSFQAWKLSNLTRFHQTISHLSFSHLTNSHAKFFHRHFLT